jgi:drug/metabolite transporter (DMT)-like permease
MNLSIFLSIICALAWGIQSIFLKKAMGSIPFQMAMLITLTVNFLALILLIGLGVGEGFSVFSTLSASIYFYFMVAGFLNYVLGRGLYYSSFRFISVTQSTSISSTYPIISVAFAIIVLGEKLALHQLAGVGLTLFGIYLLMMKGKR